MTVRKRTARNGESRLFIEIRYKALDGRRTRFRRDAQVQTKAGAQAEERRLLAELATTGSVAAPPDESLNDVLRHTFEDAVRHYRLRKMACLKPSTRATYEHRLGEVLLPRFGSRALAELRADDLAQLDAELARQDLSPSTRRNLHIVFRSVLREAEQAGLLDALPKLPKLPRVGRKMVRPLHRPDLDRLLRAASPRPRLAFALAAFAGLRAGEVRGLRWSDVDLKGVAITVRRSITRGEETTPKSGDQRVVPIAAPLLPLLHEASARRASPWAPVALTALGQPWGESGLNQAVKRVQARVGLSGRCFHDLRHFFVTELFRRGASAPAVQRLAGHADLATTQRYADMVASDMRAAVDLFEVNDEATDSTEGEPRSGEHR
jgi:integrase